MTNTSVSEEFHESYADQFRASFALHLDFVTPVEEGNLVMEVEPHLNRQVYEKDHWDDAIIGFRETERKTWNPLNLEVIQRLREAAFDPKGTNCLPYVHVLDLAEDGYIKPHIDSSRFCGDTVAVLSLLSDSILKFVHEKNDDHQVHCLLPKRSLYIIRGTSRYDYTHEILKNEESSFKGTTVHKDRRISIVCRNDVK